MSSSKKSNSDDKTSDTCFTVNFGVNYSGHDYSRSDGKTSNTYFTENSGHDYDGNDEMSDTYFTIDFGVNYSGHGYKDNDVIKIINDSYSIGVDKVVCISNEISEAINNIRLAQLIPQLHFTLGVHPHNAKKFTDNDLKFLESNVKLPKCFGIGEIGLDFNRNYSTKEEQINAFTKQLELAKKLDVKVYLHCRDAFGEFIQIIKSVGHYKGIVHCFTGTLEQALEFTTLGFKLGITGWLLDKRRNANLVRAVSDDRITIDMLLVETDAPFMAIKPKKSSFPSDTAIIVEEIARLKKMEVIYCGKELYKNAIEFL